MSFAPPAFAGFALSGAPLGGSTKEYRQEPLYPGAVLACISTRKPNLGQHYAKYIQYLVYLLTYPKMLC